MEWTPATTHGAPLVRPQDAMEVFREMDRAVSARGRSTPRPTVVIIAGSGAFPSTADSVQKGLSSFVQPSTNQSAPGAMQRQSSLWSILAPLSPLTTSPSHSSHACPGAAPRRNRSGERVIQFPANVAASAQTPQLGCTDGRFCPIPSCDVRHCQSSCEAPTAPRSLQCARVHQSQARMAALVRAGLMSESGLQKVTPSHMSPGEGRLISLGRGVPPDIPSRRNPRPSLAATATS
jgi:hypothetical protein